MTFLTTARMDPELRARIEARVAGRRLSADVSRAWISRQTWVAGARVMALAMGVAIVWSFFHRKSDAEIALEKRRATLLETVRNASEELTAHDFEAEGRVASWLVRSAHTYDADFVADAVKTPKGLAELLDRSAVYVRGTLGEFQTAEGVRQAATVSVKDAFLGCLLTPPKTRSERALMARVYDVYSGGAERQATQVARLHDVEAGLPFLQPSWADRVVQATTMAQLDGLQRELFHAPLEAARRGLTARLLVFAIDEPGDLGGPAELDGERAHEVRVGIVDLASEAWLVRLRRRVDPSKISAEKRSLYASGVDACALAFDVRASVARAN